MNDSSKANGSSRERMTGVGVLLAQALAAGLAVAHIPASTCGMSTPVQVAAFGPFCLFSAERRLVKDGAPVPLGSRALDILILLIERAGSVVTKQELIARVWPRMTVEESSLRVHIAGLRKALGDGQGGARYVANIAGRGYCFVGQVIAAKCRAILRRRSPRLAALAGYPADRHA